jgi:hypothetical protein
MQCSRNRFQDDCFHTQLHDAIEPCEAGDALDRFKPLDKMIARHRRGANVYPLN